MDELGKDIATFLTALALAGFATGLYWLPQHDRLFTPQRWLLWMNVLGVTLLLAFDVAEIFWPVETHLVLILARRLVFRSGLVLAAGGFLWAYLRLLRQMSTKKDGL